MQFPAVHFKAMYSSSLCALLTLNVFNVQVFKLPLNLAKQVQKIAPQ